MKTEVNEEQKKVNTKNKEEKIRGSLNKNTTQTRETKKRKRVHKQGWGTYTVLTHLKRKKAELKHEKIREKNRKTQKYK